MSEKYKKHDALGERMKGYESVTDFVLPKRMPIIGRFDGSCFHTYTRKCKRPFDDAFMNAMDEVAIALCKRIQGAQIAFVQSDEVTVLVHGYKTLKTESFASNRLVKMATLAASKASSRMTALSSTIFGKVCEAEFDGRFNVYPEADVCNNFIWRQNDASRNSLSSVCQSHFSPKKLLNKNREEQHELLHSIGVFWNDLATKYKRGRCIVKETNIINGIERSKWIVDYEIPIFSQDRNYIEKFLDIIEE